MPGFSIPSGSKDLLDILEHPVELGSVHGLQAGGVHQPVPVLARQGATALQHVVRHLVVDALHGPSVFGVSGIQHGPSVQVAVAHVPDHDGLHTLALEQLLQMTLCTPPP